MTDTRAMLGLLVPTDPAWVAVIEQDLPGLLSDHAHCELKAAQSALSLVGKYGGPHPELVAPLVALAHEETEHFAEVEKRLAATGRRLGEPRTDDYVGALRKVARRDGDAVPALLDRLLVASLVEARSCERFKLLATRLEDAELRAFYGELMASEARHYRLFAGLAETLFGVNDARARLGELAAREAQIAGRLPLGPTVHG
jgi:tRNA-(ms[2]io[6]A)-hydroxylase